MKARAPIIIKLSAAELVEIARLKKILCVQSTIEIIRRGLKLLRDQTDRTQLRSAYREASLKVRKNTLIELEDLDDLTSEGLE